MTLDIRHITLEGVNRVMDGNVCEDSIAQFDRWLETDAAESFRIPLEEFISMHASHDFQETRLRQVLRDGLHVAWMAGQVWRMKKQNEEAMSFLPVDKADLLNG